MPQHLRRNRFSKLFICSFYGGYPLSQPAGLATSQEFRVLTFDRLVSTNDAALSHARAYDPGHLWILAREQTCGRGRNGRIWHSPPGNLYASLLLIDPCTAAKAPELGFVAGVAVAEVLREQLGGGPTIKLKWPNDILFDGAKLCGMLLESHSLEPQKLACVLGIGINISSFPSGLPYPATSLQASGGPALSPEQLLSLISERLCFWLNVWSGPDGFASIRQAWLERAAGVGEPIKVETASARLEGIFKTIDSTGRLILTAREGNDTAISAGDVFLSAARARADCTQ